MKRFYGHFRANLNVRTANGKLIWMSLFILHTITGFRVRSEFLLHMTSPVNQI